MIETMYFVYGYPTIRFDGPAVMISSAVRSILNQACGFSAATWVKRAHCSPSCMR